MVPTLRDGDVVIAVEGRWRRRGTADPAGRVVLARFRSMPDRLVVKRAAGRASTAAGEAWHLDSDNPFAGGDSRVHGPADVTATVWLRLRRRAPWIGRVR
jgi:hypothetical protein